MPAYMLPPIDWFDAAVVFDPRAVPSAPVDATYESGDSPNPIAVAYRAAVPQFDILGWEGDGTWYYGALPADGSTLVWVMVKQSNNGTTYVYCTQEMPWLSDTMFSMVYDDGRRVDRF